ncbi:MAG: type III-A CRISPR-associated RAMP protein Csm5 [Saccharofermentanales bacterium]
MKTHLKTYTLEIKTLSPLFIGSGESLTKKEYIYIPGNDQVIIPDFPRMIDHLERKGLTQKFIGDFPRSRNSMHEWLKFNNIKTEDYSKFTLYTVKIGNAVDEAHSLNEIQTFTKDPYLNPYIPGSSLKGYIRTALLNYRLLADKQGSEKLLSELERGDFAAKGTKNLLRIETERAEKNLLNRLHFKEDAPGDMVNSVMRGIQIADIHFPDRSSLVLCKKIDVDSEGVPKPLNIIRECVKPGTVIRSTLTIDEKILQADGLSIDQILKALDLHAAIQRNQYSKFRRPDNFVDIEASGHEMFLGGGSGFIAKTILYSFDNARAVKLTSRILDKNFLKHRHNEDVNKNMSPHTLKCTKFENKYYQMGRCQCTLSAVD